MMSSSSSVRGGTTRTTTISTAKKNKKRGREDQQDEDSDPRRQLFDDGAGTKPAAKTQSMKKKTGGRRASAAKNASSPLAMLLESPLFPSTAADNNLTTNFQVMELCMDNIRRTLAQVVLPPGKEVGDSSLCGNNNNPSSIATKKATNNMTKEEKAEHRNNARLWHANCIERKNRSALDKTYHDELKRKCTQQSEKILSLEAALNKARERERKLMAAWDDILDNFASKVESLK